MVGTEVYARLSKDTTKVYCGRVQPNGRAACQETLGGFDRWIITFPLNADLKMLRAYYDAGMLEDIPDVAGPDGHNGILRIMRFAEGWAQGADGIWAKTRHAADAQRHGRTPQYRRPAPVAKGLNVESPHRFMTPGSLPAKVRCPRPACGQVQILDAATLCIVVWGEDRDNCWFGPAIQDYWLDSTNYRVWATHLAQRCERSSYVWDKAEAVWWQRLALWLETASERQRKNCYARYLAAYLRTVTIAELARRPQRRSYELESPRFARSFLNRLGITE